MNELFQIYKDAKQSHIKEFLPLIEDSPLYPVIRDKNGVVLSLPPIINGEHSKMTLDMKNVFIESTGLDMNKLMITLKTTVAAYSRYCKKPFTVEPVRIVYLDKDGNEIKERTMVTPDLSKREVKTTMKYVCKQILGTDVEPK